MPILSMDGKLARPVFICLQESLGRLSPRVLQTVYIAQNIHVTFSKSDKLTKSYIQYWAKEVLQPSIQANCLLLLDFCLAKTDWSHIYWESIRRKKLHSNFCDYCLRQQKTFNLAISTSSDNGNISIKGVLTM